MSEGYYPKYYLKKRQRDNLYRRIWQIIGGLLLVAVAIMVGLVLFRQLNPQRVNKPADRAAMREELETKQRLADAANSPAPAASNEVSRPVEVKFEGKLEELEYSASMPMVHVSILGGSGELSADPHEVDETNAEVPVTGGSSEDAAQPEPAGVPENSPPADPVKTDKLPEAGDSGGSAERRIIEKPEKKPQEAEPDPENEPEAIATKEPGFVVYAGYFKTRDSAVASKKDLNVLGFPGTITENGGEYLIRVASVSTVDEATVMQEKLVQGGFVKSFVVRQP